MDALQKQLQIVVHPRKSASVAVAKDEDAAVLWKPQRLFVEHGFLHPHFQKVSHFLAATRSSLLPQSNVKMSLSFMYS